MLELKVERVQQYLSKVYKGPAEVSRIIRLGGVEGTAELKGFGYGVPYLIEFSVEAEVKRVVLETVRREGFGHDHFADRARRSRSCSCSSGGTIWTKRATKKS